MTAREAAPIARSDFERALTRAQRAWHQEMRRFQIAPSVVPFPPYPMLEARHLAHCRVMPEREAILAHLPTNGVAAELGVETGAFSQRILEVCRPRELHLIDRDLGCYGVPAKFGPKVAAGRVVLHEGDSADRLRMLPDDHFDFIYVDGDHSYEGVTGDIAAAIPKLKQDGVLIFNDYTFWSPCEAKPYGVVQAVNELCVGYDWEVIYYALAHYGYCDVCVRRIPG